RPAPARGDADAGAPGGVAAHVRCRRIGTLARGVRGDSPLQPQLAQPPAAMSAAAFLVATSAARRRRICPVDPGHCLSRWVRLGFYVAERPAREYPVR